MAADKENFVETVDDPAMLKHLDYQDGSAEVEVPGYALVRMPFTSHVATGEAGIDQEKQAIRAYGYVDKPPIEVWPGPDGSWLIDDKDAARWTAAKAIAQEFFTNLLGNKVRSVRLLLHSVSRDGAYRVSEMGFGQAPE